MDVGFLGIAAQQSRFGARQLEQGDDDFFHLRRNFTDIVEKPGYLVGVFGDHLANLGQCLQFGQGRT